jgi:putative DNA primase/helicase
MNSPEKTPRTSEYPVWLAVPHEARDALREVAGRLENGQQAVGWDKEASLWFARPGCDLERVTDWLPDSSRRAGGGDAELEFLDALTQAGLVVQGMPVMDGARHRVSTVEDKNGKQSGVYRGFLDRRPGGWFINYHRAETAKDVTKWSATGGESDPVNRLHIKAAARQAQDDAARARAETYARQTLAAQQLYDRLPAADPAHPYLVRKGITPTPDLRETRNGALVVPFFNASGAFKTLQYIPPEGEKYLFKDAPKQGHFLVVGGPLKAGEPVLYAEGYATARSLNLGTGHPVVMTIDAGNMVAVAKVLHEQYPQSQHLFLADFDHAKAENKGLLMATAAAEAVGGQVLYPAFNDEEKARGLTDFNDLHLSRGLDELRTQVAPQLVTATEEKTMSLDRNPDQDSTQQLHKAAPESSQTSPQADSGTQQSASGDPKSTAGSDDREQARTLILMDADNGMVWDGQTFKAVDLAEAERFTPIDGLKAALELEHSQRYALEGAAIEIHRYMPELDESVRVINTDAAKTWPELRGAFKKAGLEVTQEAYQSIRNEVVTGVIEPEKPQPAALPEALPVENRQSAPAPVAEALPAVGTGDVPVQQAAPVIEPEKPQSAALPEALPVENRQSAPAPVAEALPAVGTGDMPVQQAAPVIEPEKPQSAALPEALPVENRQSAPAPLEETSAAVGTGDVPVQQAAPVIEPEKPEPAALPEAIPVQGQQPASAPVMESEPFLPDDLPKSLLRQPAMAGEQPAEGAAADAIWVGAPRPRGTEEEPQASNIDKDTLLARLSTEKQSESAVLYKLDGEPAFVDHGTRLEMAKGASQSDEKVVAALLIAAQFYRGRIELTGSDEFKAKAIDLIAHHQINVEMKNPVQQAALNEARRALNVTPEVPNAVAGDEPPAYDKRAQQPEAQAPQAAQPQTVPTQSVAPELVTQPAPLMVQPQYQPLEVADLNQGAPKPAGQPVTEGVQIERQSAAPGPSNEPGQQQAQASPKISPAIHQPFQAAKDGVQGKILASGQAPFRFEDNNAESTYIKLRTKTGVQTFWGKELAGLLRDTRVQPGKMVTLQWLGKEPVTVKVPRKDDEGFTLGYDEKQAHRNQWALTVTGNPTVRTGQDEGVKLGAYDAVRFAVVQQALINELGIDVPMPSRPKDGLYWMLPNGEGSAKAGDELTAPRPPIDPKNTAGEPVISSWTQQGNLDMYLVRGDGPYLQGIARQENEYRHVLVSLPGSSDAPPMVFNAVTPEGLQPIGAGNGINRSGGQPVARENIAFKLEGDSAVRIGKLDAPASVPPDLHVRLGFDERWKEENVLPKSAPTAAPSVRPSDPRPA